MSGAIIKITEIEMNGETDKIAQEIAQVINAKRERVIKQKLKEIVGIDLQEESKDLLKRLHTVRQGNETSIYFNDGSIECKRIVTFVKKDIHFDSENFSIECKETYY